MEKNIELLLEEKFLTYADLKTISVVESGEKLVSLANQGVSFTLLDGLISPSTGKEIYVRVSVANKLSEAQIYLDKLMPGCILDVVYGYRALRVQRDAYKEIRSKILQASPDKLTDDDLNEEIHRFVAVPDVAGHPTGGAVDVRMLDQNGQELDMGTSAHDFIKESYTFNPCISKISWGNRQKLRQAMLSVGFAPFDGEWWHFSYGDQEWAAYYGQPNAIYGQIEFEDLSCPK